MKFRSHMTKRFSGKSKSRACRRWLPKGSTSFQKTLRRTRAFIFETNDRCLHSKKARDIFYPAHSAICIIPLTDPSVADFAKSYPTINLAAMKLRKLLKAHSPRFRFNNDLFDLPYNNATGAIQSRVEYLQFKNGNGVMFLTQYSQELHPNPVNNEELTCNFQGLSTDGKYYVAARLTITHPSLPKGIDFTDKIRRDNKRLYLKKQERLLNTYAEDSFQPSLRTLKQLITSISIK